MNVSRVLPLAVVGLVPFIFPGGAQGDIIPGTSVLLNGHPVTAFAEVDASNRLSSVGFQVSGAAVRDPGAEHAALFLSLPSEGSGTGFNVLQFDWNPEGHEPLGIYDLPHFDFHYYYISDAERMAIPANETAPVSPQFLPSDYSQPGPTVPEMGGHALDLTGPEFNGGTFTHTFIYGFHRGQEIFLEPMLTQAYMQGLSGSSTFAIRQPSVYGMASLPSLVPGSARYSYDSSNDLYTISVGDFLSPTEVPEPASLILLSIGIPAAILLGSRSRRKD
jgi:hypothetical protein